ncbi:MAG: thiol-disulfide oxidoreductase DCC family protein [Chitinophagales bacterium]|nr:thiol-disulfide oxidoreductase DCC family protein [Chitinophagales bacterium]MDW8428442.1 thiol-disulfide oxidoreductase DCC family protein [Chitinophagales bacterium]
MDLLPDPVIFFDGHCNLCSGLVQWIIRRDRRKVFRFAPLQSAAAQKIVGPKAAASGTILLFEKGHLYEKSTAALRIIKRLPGLWPVIYCAVIIPKPIRDWIYLKIAANRYRWFGRRQQCYLPEAGIEDRFL